MKAIIIKFNGTIPNGSVLASKLCDIIGEYVTTEEVDITMISDKEVEEALIRCTIPPVAVKITTESKDNNLDKLEALCKDIIVAVGATSLKPVTVQDSDLIEFLIKHKAQYSEFLPYVAKINSSGVYKLQRHILEKYDLLRLPELLRDINPFIKLY